MLCFIRESVKNMGKKAVSDLVKVGFNLPRQIISEVREYSIKNSLPLTSAYIILLRKGLEYEKMLTQLPSIYNSAINNILGTEIMKDIAKPKNED